MYQFELLTNIKRSNQNSPSAKVAENYEEPEFSYNDVLYDEMSRSSKQRKRNTSKNNNSSGNVDLKEVNLFKSQFQFPINYKMPNIVGDNTPNPYTKKSTYDELMDYIEQLIKERTVVKGDANGDGVVDLNDLKTMVDRMFDENVDVKMNNVDFDGDGKISLQDISEVIKIIVGQDDDTNKKNKINDDPIIPDPPKQILKGDATGDGKVNYRDVKAIELAQIHLGGKIDEQAADMDNDGKITAVDVSKARKLANEYENKFQSIRGDSNGDGIVDERDYNNVKGYIDNVDSSEDFVLKNSDVNGDGKVDDKDLKIIRDLADGLKINYSERTHLGDVNGDGIISVADIQAINNYNNRRATGKEIYINNADVNGDGKVDSADSTAILDLLRNVKKAARLVPVYINGQQNGDFIKTGDNFILLEQQGDSLKIQYTTADGNEKIGWVHESVFEPEPDPDPIFIPWEGTALRNVPAYTNENLDPNSRIGNEAVYKGDKVKVLDENDNAYQVEYPTKYGTKIRWVSKDIFIEPKIDPIPEPLKSLVDYWDGRTWTDHTYLSGVSQCKEFASYIFNQLYGVGYIGSGSTRDYEDNWRIRDLAKGVYQVDEVAETRNANDAKEAFRKLFEKAQPGDFIQIKRGHDGAHSAIFVGWTDDGKIQWLDANADGNNGVKLQTYSLDELVATHYGKSGSTTAKKYPNGFQWNVAMSIYRAR